MDVYLVPEVPKVPSPLDRGPLVGERALQKALREANIPWLHIGGNPHSSSIPWFWYAKQMSSAILWAQRGFPFIFGSCVLFGDSRRPCATDEERALMDAKSCILMVTESQWYAELLEDWRGKNNKAPIVVAPYPLDPIPEGPTEAKYDVFIYVKSGVGPNTVSRLEAMFPRHITLRKGSHQRKDVASAARQSLCCVYLSDDDRGPLVATETALCGCPLIGMERGCPWVTFGGIGVEVDNFRIPVLRDSIKLVHAMDRDQVRKAALDHWNPQRIVKTLVDAIASVRESFDLPATANEEWFWQI